MFSLPAARHRESDFDFPPLVIANALERDCKEVSFYLFHFYISYTSHKIRAELYNVKAACDTCSAVVKDLLLHFRAQVSLFSASVSCILDRNVIIIYEILLHSCLPR